MSASPGPVSISLQLPRGPTASAQARDGVRAGLDGRVPGDTLADVLLVVSELVTNAVIHGQGTIELQAELDGDTFRGQVVDQGSGFEHDIDQRGMGTIGGLGLLVVSQIARTWGVHEGTTHVWFEIPVAGRRGDSTDPQLG